MSVCPCGVPQAGADAARGSEKAIPHQRVWVLLETVISSACVVVTLKQIGFSLGEINLGRLAVVSHVLLCLEKCRCSERDGQGRLCRAVI